jgi:hypothetical protein
MTITAWINVTDFSGYRGILGKTDATNTSYPAPYDFYLITATGIPAFYRGDGSATSLHYGHFDGTTAPATGKWQFIAVTQAGNTITHYLNGATNGSGTMSNAGSFTITNGSGIARIGSRNDSVTLMKGSMDEVRIYNRALSGTEVTNLYNLGAEKLNVSPVSNLTSGLVGYWTFDGKDTPWTSSSAGTATDRSGNGNTGTLTNMSRSTSPIVQNLKRRIIKANSSQRHRRRYTFQLTIKDLYSRHINCTNLITPSITMSLINHALTSTSQNETRQQRQ